MKLLLSVCFLWVVVSACSPTPVQPSDEPEYNLGTIGNGLDSDALVDCRPEARIRIGHANDPTYALSPDMFVLDAHGFHLGGNDAANVGTGASVSGRVTLRAEYLHLPASENLQAFEIRFASLFGTAGIPLTPNRGLQYVLATYSAANSSMEYLIQTISHTTIHLSEPASGNFMVWQTSLAHAASLVFPNLEGIVKGEGVCRHPDIDAGGAITPEQADDELSSPPSPPPASSPPRGLPKIFPLH